MISHLCAVMAGIEDLHSSCFDLSPIKPCRPGCCQTQRTFCICFVYQFDGFVGSAMQTDPAMFCATNERMHLPCSAAAMCIWLCQVLVALCRFFVASVSKLFFVSCSLTEDGEQCFTDAKM